MLGRAALEGGNGSGQDERPSMSQPTVVRGSEYRPLVDADVPVEADVEDTVETIGESEAVTTRRILGIDSNQFIAAVLIMAVILTAAAISATLIIQSNSTFENGQAVYNDAAYNDAAVNDGVVTKGEETYWFNVRVGLFAAMTVFNLLMFLTAYLNIHKPLTTNIIFSAVILSNFVVTLATFFTIGRLTGAYLIAAMVSGMCLQFTVNLMQGKFHWGTWWVVRLLALISSGSVFLHIIMMVLA